MLSLFHYDWKHWQVKYRSYIIMTTFSFCTGCPHKGKGSIPDSSKNSNGVTELESVAVVKYSVQSMACAVTKW